MKKFLLSLAALVGFSTMAIAGDGTASSPYTVDDIVAKGDSYKQDNAYVTGYIVGTIPATASITSIQYTEFSAKDASNTNMVIASSSGETNYTYCMTIQLPGGAGSVRDALSVSQNPDNIGKRVTLYGNISKYCQGPGLRDTSAYWWGATGEAIETPETPSEVWTVAKVLSEIDGGYRGAAQVQGYVTAFGTNTEDNVAKYGDINYYISDDKDGSNQLYIYNGYGLNGEKFTSLDDAMAKVKIGDLVVVEGTCDVYNEDPQLARGSKILSINGEGGGDTPSGPSADAKGIVQTWDKGIGFPEGSAAAPAAPATFTATNTGIEYEVMGCYTNAGYLMINGKNYEGAYVSWSLDTSCTYLVLTTSGSCSTNSNSVVNIYANGNLIKSGLQVNSVSTEYSVAIPEQYQAAGTVYKVESGTTAYNQQFASFKYISGDSGVDEVLAADDSEAVYYDLQGRKVANPERGIFVKVVGGKAVKVVK